MIDPRDRLARALGVAPEARSDLVRDMLERHGRERASYWLQLTLATAIATLGLVLGSTGVVIGGMLVSPLMTPIVELGMGLAIGSPLLVVRSFNRVAASAALVIAGAAAITLLLPYHDVTAEIAARTSPTVLDLAVAIFCAVAAAFTAVRASDTMGVAAGTAIGIALVPPICVVGYGIGTFDGDVAVGALLLFVANFSAIVLVAVLGFLLLRFDAVDVHALEERVIEAGARSSWVGRKLHRLFGARYGRVLRVAMPLVVAGAVYVPLRSALEELAWEIRVKGRIGQLVESLPQARTAIRSSYSVSRGSVSVRLAVVGTSEDAERLRRELTERVAEIAGVTPSVEVSAVVSASELRHLTFAERAEPRTVAPAPKPTDDREVVAATLRELWPSSTAGGLASWHLGIDSSGARTLEVVHVGPRLGAAAEEALARAVASGLALDAGPVRVDDRAYPPEIDLAAPVEGDAGADLAAARDRAFALAADAAAHGLHVCDGEEREAGAMTAEELDASAARLRALVSGAPPGSVSVDTSALVTLRVSPDPCPAPRAPEDGGAPLGDADGSK